MNDPTVLAALIAAAVAAIAGIANFFLTVHRNKQDGVTKFRMEWIEHVRDEFTTILGWDWYRQCDNGKICFNFVETMRNSTNKIALYLNVRDDYDSRVLKLCYQYLEETEKLYSKYVICDNIESIDFKLLFAVQASNEWKSTETIKKELIKLVRVYLKMEWTRVKVESSLIKIKYWYCWRPFKGFLPDKAIEKYTNEYINIELNGSK